MILEMPRTSFQEENSLLSCPLFTREETTPIICYGMSSILQVFNVINDGGPVGPGADCILWPIWEQNSCSQRENFSLVEVFWGQHGMFQGQDTVQVAPQTAPYGLLLQSEW